jgi:hypothetical protein
MAILRSADTTNDSNEIVATHAPESAIPNQYSKRHQTADINQIQKEYTTDAISLSVARIDTGALIPRDMTVKLVRAEVANWETFLQCVYSITLTLFGLFLGALISTPDDGNQMSNLEITATISFGVISFCLICLWIYLKVQQSNQGIKVPYEMLNQFAVEDAEKGN